MADDCKKRNNSIDIFRYFCALLVVVIHTSPFYGSNLEPFGVFLREFVSRIAVPYFFVISGYFLFKKLEKTETSGYLAAWNQTKTYIIWSIPYILLNFVILVGNDFSPFAFAKDTVFRFFVHGSSSHFWFFPALIYGTLFVTFVYKRFGWKTIFGLSIVFYIFGCLGSSYLPIGEKMPVLSVLFTNSNFYILRRLLLTGIPFITLGGLIFRCQDRFESLFTKKSYQISALSITVALFIAEKAMYYFVGCPVLDVNTLMLYPLMTVIVVILLKHPLESQTELAQYSRTCANFIYYTHIAFITIVSRIFAPPATIMFLATSILLTIIGVLAHRVASIRKWLN